jgi:hypothetical protein
MQAKTEQGHELPGMLESGNGGGDMRRLFRDILVFLAAVCASFNLGARWHEAANSELLIIVTMICLAVSAILGEADK